MNSRLQVVANPVAVGVPDEGRREDHRRLLEAYIRSRWLRNLAEQSNERIRRGLDAFFVSVGKYAWEVTEADVATWHGNLVEAELAVATRRSYVGFVRVARGLFTGTTHGPFFRDRLLFRWDEGTYKQVGKYRFATPFYHLNRYLYFASKQDWQSATRHIEPGVEMDRRLTEELGLGPFLGGSDVPFVNGRMYFSKGGQDYFADFGRTGRLVGLGKGELPYGR